MIPNKKLIFIMGACFLFLGPMDYRFLALADEAQVLIHPGIKAFHPKITRVKVGEMLTWKNRDNEPHFLTSAGPSFKGVHGEIDELEIHQYLQPGQSFSHSFQEAETYYYFCAIHMEMWGTVVVIE